MVKVLAIYKVNLPAILEIFLVELRKMVDFENMNADAILGLIKEDLTVKVLITGVNSTFEAKGNLASTGAKDTDPLNNLLAQYGLFIAGGLIVALLFSIVLLVLKKSKKVQNMVKKKIKGTIKNLLWNGFMRSVTFSYINICVNLLIFIKATEIWTVSEYSNVLVNLDLLLVYPAVTAYIAYTSKYNLDE